MSLRETILNGFMKRVAAFRHAFAGIRTLIRTQPHAWFHAFATIVVTAAWALEFSRAEWIGLVFAIVLVWAAEALNTAVEFLADATHPERHPLIKNAKDVAAAGVLIAAIGAAVIGVLLFTPYVRGE